MIEIERIATPEEERVLAAFGAQPEAIFTTKDVHVRLPLARGNCRTADPSEARSIASAGRTRHDAALITWHDHDLRAAWRTEYHGCRVLLEKCDVGCELAAFMTCDGRYARGHDHYQSSARKP